MTANRFAEAYAARPVSSIIEVSGPTSDTEELTAVFNSVCLDIRNHVAPLRIKKPKPHMHSLYKSEMRAFRQADGKTNEMLKDTLSKYQYAVKAARTKYFFFYNLISRTVNCPKVYKHCAKPGYSTSRGFYFKYL